MDIQKYEPVFGRDELDPHMCPYELIVSKYVNVRKLPAANGGYKYEARYINKKGRINHYVTMIPEHVTGEIAFTMCEGWNEE